ncbi:hypothetical protein OXB_0128 [Bacillus sp. OxB-1]|uniref:hypothetical protein n=1 Tax=Bacillus sp. (strain OxB-1) TaxID=98228 RepID=UPI000581BCB6|nr:hypothetical protein [Bacillus sp. OxB-1]BAQ08600.1 hypothetical protein OXB_0128 [Bacillus sp. OxB-1]
MRAIAIWYVPDAAERRERFRGKMNATAREKKATEARMEIIEQLASEGKTEEEIEQIIRNFGL